MVSFISWALKTKKAEKQDILQQLQHNYVIEGSYLVRDMDACGDA